MGLLNFWETKGLADSGIVVNLGEMLPAEELITEEPEDGIIPEAEPTGKYLIYVGNNGAGEIQEIGKEAFHEYEGKNVVPLSGLSEAGIQQRLDHAGFEEIGHIDFVLPRSLEEFDRIEVNIDRPYGHEHSDSERQASYKADVKRLNELEANIDEMQLVKQLPAYADDLRHLIEADARLSQDQQMQIVNTLDAVNVPQHEIQEPAPTPGG